MTEVTPVAGARAKQRSLNRHPRLWESSVVCRPPPGVGSLIRTEIGRRQVWVRLDVVVDLEECNPVSQ
jgi:hypothetical protein